MWETALNSCHAVTAQNPAMLLIGESRDKRLCFCFMWLLYCIGLQCITTLRGPSEFRKRALSLSYRITALWVLLLPKTEDSHPRAHC